MKFCGWGFFWRFVDFLQKMQAVVILLNFQEISEIFSSSKNISEVL
jgi:hypothetical protein